MTDEEIIDHLKNERTLVAGGTWYFTGLTMMCAEENCCEDHYDSFEEALESVRDLSERRTRELRLL